MADAAKIKIAEQRFKSGMEAFTKGNLGYAVDSFLTCTKLVPEHLPYRQALRKTERKVYGDNGKGAAMAGLKMKPAQLRIKTAKARKKWLDVIEAAEDALVINPWDPGLLMEVGAACLELNMIPVGTWVAETAAELDKETADLYRLLANLYERGQQFEKAIVALETVKKIDPTDADAGSRARQLAASATIKKGKLGDEEAALKSVAAPEESGSSADAGSPEERAQRQIAQLEERFAKESTSVPLCVQLAEAYQKQGHYEKAVEYYEKAVQLTGGRDSDLKTKLLDCQIEPLRHKLTVVKERINTFDKSIPDAAKKANELKAHFNALNNEIIKREIDYYKYRTELKAEDTAAHFELGYRYLQAGQLDDAIRSLQQARADAKRKWEALCWLGFAFWKKKNYALADKNLKDAEEAIPSSDEEAKKKVLYYRGCIAQERGVKAEAIEHFNNIAAIDYGYKDVAKRLDQLNA